MMFVDGGSEVEMGERKERMKRESWGRLSRGPSQQLEVQVLMRLVYSTERGTSARGHLHHCHVLKLPGRVYRTLKDNICRI